jgi:hypothetical protein
MLLSTTKTDVFNVAGMGYPDIADYDHTAARNNVSAYTS